MEFIRKNRWVAWLLIVFGGAMMAASCFDSGVTDLDDTRVLQPVCSDYPPGEAPADCVTSREVLDEDRAIDSWPLFLAGLLFLAAGLSILTGQGPFRASTAPARKPGAYLLAPIALQDSTGVTPMLEDGPATVLLVLLAVAAIVGFVVWLVRRDDGTEDPYS